MSVRPDDEARAARAVADRDAADAGDAADAADALQRKVDALAARWRSLGARSMVATNAKALVEALVYLALIALLAWLWATPEADFRYWGL